MKKQILSIVTGIIFFALTVNADSVSTPLSQPDVIAISKPSIVKIYHQIGGKLSIPTIKLDIKTMSLSVDNNYTAPPTTTYMVSLDSVISYKFDYTKNQQTAY